MKEKTIEDYRDLLLLPHPVSSHHIPMRPEDRAAQFSPFAALTGYEDSIQETTRGTLEKVILEEDQKEALNRILQWVLQQEGNPPKITIEYFLPDTKKAGGSYQRVTGRIRGRKKNGELLLLEGGTQIPLEDIVEITGDFPEELE